MSNAYTVAQLAKAWNTHPRNVRRLIDAGRLKAFSISGNNQAKRKSGIRISAEAKAKWEAENEITTNDPAQHSDAPADGGLPTSIM